MGPNIPIDKKRDEREPEKNHEKIHGPAESVRRMKRHKVNAEIVNRNLGILERLGND